MKKEHFLVFLLLWIVFLSLAFPKIKYMAYCLDKNNTEKNVLENAKLEHYNVMNELAYHLYYKHEDMEIAYTVKNSVDLYLPFIKKDLNYDKEHLFNIIIYNTEEEMRTTLNITNGDTPMGAYYGNALHILSPKEWVNEENVVTDVFLSEGPIIHEIAHMVLHEKTKGNYPVFFSEGVALYIENKYTGYEWRKDLEEASSSISYKDLKNNFRGLNQNIAYRKAFSFVKDMVDIYGEDYIGSVADNLEKGRGFERSLIIQNKKSISENLHCIVYTIGNPRKD